MTHGRDGAARAQPARSIAEQCRLAKPGRLQTMNTASGPHRRATASEIHSLTPHVTHYSLGIAISSQFMSIKQVATLLNVSPSWVYKSAARCGLPMYRFDSGRNAKIQVDVSELQAWVKQQRVDHV
uniref:helix-turn-helix domain-containing protein n=1 Tax=Streptomyces sp. HSW2009 TaxID=3142890 RepID=UPI0032EA9E9A